jgi:uncharacterized protein YcnI
MSFHVPARRVVIAGLAATFVLAVPVSANAHVTVSADNAEQGGYAKLVFRVPNEADKASTTKLVFTLPTDTPIGSIRTKPKPGWTAVVTKATLARPVKVGETTLTEAPSTVTFTAASGAGIQPGQFDEFELSGGPLPTSTEQLVLPAAQYYSDGTVVRWDQRTTGSTEPERPAPVLALAAASGEGHSHSGDDSSAADGPSDDAHGDSAHGDAGEDDVARGLGGAALVVALGAAGLGFVALRRSRRGRAE